MTAGTAEAVTGFWYLPRGNITDLGDSAAQDCMRPSSRAWRIA